MINKLVGLSAILLSTSALAFAPLDVSLEAHANDAGGYRNYPIDVSSNHHAKVVNVSDQRQEFIVYYRLCIENHGCNDNHHYKITLNPHGEWQDGMILRSSAIFARFGTFVITATTRVKGDGVDKDFNHTGLVYVK